ELRFVGEYGTSSTVISRTPRRCDVLIQRRYLRTGAPLASSRSSRSRLAGSLPMRSRSRRTVSGRRSTESGLSTYSRPTLSTQRVVSADTEALMRTPLKELQEELDPANFWVIHRSTIVSANAIAGVTRDFRGRALVKLKSRAEELPVSEAHEHLFKQM